MTARVLLLLLCIAGIGRLAAGLSVPVKAAAAQVLLDRAFAHSRVTHRAEKPWRWADMAPVARLDVPRLGIRRIVLGGGSGQAMAFGPTLLPGAADLDRVAVIAAHRDTHFRFLAHLREGDGIEVQPIVGPVRRYRVTGGEVVRWDAFMVPHDGARLALVTCWPFESVRHGPLRYVAWAEPA